MYIISSQMISHRNFTIMIELFKVTIFTNRLQLSTISKTKKKDSNIISFPR